MVYGSTELVQECKLRQFVNDKLCHYSFGTILHDLIGGATAFEQEVARQFLIVSNLEDVGPA